MWSKTYGEATKDEGAFSIIETSDGGYALAGTHLLVKTDAQGNMIWNKTFQDGDIHSMVAASNGGFILGGTTRFGEQYREYWLVKTDSDGVAQWNKTYARTNDNVANWVVATSDGGYALLGTSSSTNESESGVWLVKTDHAGNMQWNMTYRQGAPNAIIQTSDGGYAMAGSAAISEDNLDFWLAKTDEFGNMQWNNTYSGTEDDIARSLVQASDGGYALAGTKNYTFGVFAYAYDTQATEPEDSGIWLVKTDADGIMQWNKTYGEGDARSIILTSDGGYALTGDNWLLKTDALGNTEWMEHYEGSSSYWMSTQCLIVASDGGYAAAGDIFYAISIDSDFWLIKTNEFGVIPEHFTLVTISLFFALAVPILLGKKRLLGKHHQPCNCPTAA